jgi:hypothetical protein
MMGFAGWRNRKRTATEESKMKKGIITLLAAAFVMAVGTASAQVILYEQAADYAGTGDKSFSQQPTSWTDVDSRPVGISSNCPPFSYGGVNPLGTALSKAQIHKNGRMHMQYGTNFHYMVAFDCAPTRLKTIYIEGSTWGGNPNTAVAGDATYLIVHDSSQTYDNGWYATLLHDRTAVSTYSYTVDLADATWFEFTPSTLAGTVPLGTIGAPVASSVVTDANLDEAGYYADVYGTGNGNANHYLWNFAAYELKAALYTDPTAVTMTFSDAATVMSNSVEVSYTEGAIPTNVNVTSISLINTSHAGFSVSPGSLAMSSPAPASESVWVEFDNNTAGLVANETATADLELVWSEAGSGTSATSMVPVTVQFLAASAENILAAFFSESALNNNNAGDADINFAGIDTRVTGIQWNNNQNGSSDTSYGTLLGDAPVNGGCGQISSWNGYKLYIALTNNSGFPVELDSINFDIARKYGQDSNDTVSVTIDGDVAGAPVVSPAFSNIIGEAYSGVHDFTDFDWDLTAQNLELADGDAVTITFTWAGGGLGMLDNVAILGKGVLPALVRRDAPVDGSDLWAVLSVSGLEDAPVSQPVDLVYAEGDLMTNVVITGVSISNTIGSGLSAVGSFPIALTTPEITNSAVFELVFDNSEVDLAPGEYTEHVVTIEYDEPGRGPLTAEFVAYGWQPEVTPSNNLIAMFDTELIAPDTAIKGVLGGFTTGNFEDDVNLPGKGKGSLDGTYGSLATSRTDGTNVTWCALINGTPELQVATLTITNTTTANIELSTLHFDMGLWYSGGADTFTLGVSGDVTPDSDVLTTNPSVLGWNNHDFDDHDIDLTYLADHTLAAGESVSFTWTIHPKDNEFIGMFIDNVALAGDFDAYGGWADVHGAGAPGENHDGDNLDNLAEFASGNDPWVADGPFGTSWMENDGGTDWLYQVHTERQDDPDLTYGDAGSASVLSYLTVWDTNDVETVGASSGPGLWISVTNRTQVTGDAKFLVVPVELN